MPITFWNRLELRTRSDNPAPGLIAALRDPLWIPSRQRQLAEFRAENAGSPAWVEVKYDSTIATAEAPLEPMIADEGFTPTLMMRLELGQVFEMLLEDEGESGLIAQFYADYPLPHPLPESDSADVLRVLRLIHDRAMDGYELLNADLPSFWSVLTNGQQAAVLRARERLANWVEDVFGTRGVRTTIASAWQPHSLAYAKDISATGPGESRLALHVTPDTNGALDWYSADIVSQNSATNAIEVVALPARLTVPGMPNARWWEFEDREVDLAAMRVDTRDLARMLVSDFALHQSNDWFSVPLPIRVGELVAIRSLRIHDVFDNVLEIMPQHMEKKWNESRWMMYSQSDYTPESGPAFFYLVPSVSSMLQAGETLEEVAFMLDDVSNLVWAVEERVESVLGTPESTNKNGMTTPSPESPDIQIPLYYELQSPVPSNWFPFLADRDTVNGGEPPLLWLGDILGYQEVNEPRGRILQGFRPEFIPSPNIVPSLRVYTVPRYGVRILRRPYLARWTDGSTHLWIGRERHIRAAPGISPLFFDRVLNAETRNRRL